MNLSNIYSTHSMISVQWGGGGESNWNCNRHECENISYNSNSTSIHVDILSTKYEIALTPLFVCTHICAKFVLLNIVTAKEIHVRTHLQEGHLFSNFQSANMQTNTPQVTFAELH